MRGLLTAVVLSAAPVSAGEGCVVSDETVDLSCTFADAPTRDQGSIGNCHAFASVGPLESAIFRQTGRHIALSEADLFVLTQFKQGDLYAPIKKDYAALYTDSENPEGPATLSRVRIESILRKRSGQTSADVWVEEGNSLKRDMALALQHGLARRETVPYVRFSRAYLGDEGNGGRGGAKARAVGATQTAFADLVNYYSIRNSLQNFELPYQVPSPEVRETAPSADEAEAAMLAGDEPGRMLAIRIERAETLQLFSAFALESRSFEDVPAPRDRAHDAAAQRAVCRSVAESRRDWLVGQLRSGRPVAIGFDLKGFESWGFAEETGDAGHGVVLTGYVTQNGAKVFKVRNSWGGWNPDIPEDQLCRIDTMHVVTTPNDAAWLASLKR